MHTGDVEKRRNHAYALTIYKTDTDIIPEIFKITIKILIFHLRKTFEVIILLNIR